MRFSCTEVFAAMLLAAPALALAGADADGDGVGDAVDNCTLIDNSDQTDTDGDGIGNACDADFNNDCAVNSFDLGVMKSVFFSDDEEVDLTGDGQVNFFDLAIMKAVFFSPPGPAATPNLCDSGEIDPVALGPKLTIGSGSDPDVAVDAAGNVHLVYADSGSTYYRLITGYPDATVVGPELRVGGSEDPQVVVDSAGDPHVTMGSLRYARWTGSEFDDMTIASLWRKPRIAIDSQDRIYLTASRESPREIVLYVVENGVVTEGPVTVGNDNNGAIDCGANDVCHLTWRSSSVYYNTYSIAGGDGNSNAWHSSSDFSWIAVDTRNDSQHVVNTASGGTGIHYRARTGGSLGSLRTFAQDEVDGVDDPDNVGPTIDVDVDGDKYVAFAGRDRIPYYFLVDAEGDNSAVFLLDPEDGSLSGGKFENPNVGAHPARQGAVIAWGDGTVYLRGVGQ